MTLTDPFVVMAKPTGPICNLACDYCYYLEKTDLFPAGERYRMREETLECYVRAFIEASPGPIVHFVWHGGEPTLVGRSFYERVVDLQRRYLPEGWSCLNSIQTNGTLLDDAWCAFLAKHGFAVGISIDGPAPLHDASRLDKQQRPTHAKAMRGYRLLRAHGIDPDVLCTISARNVGHPQDVYRFFLDEGIRWLQFLPVVKASLSGEVSPLSVPRGAFGSFLCTVFDEWVRHDVERIGIQVFLESLSVVSGGQASLCTMAETCGRALALEHDGGIYACDHFVDPGHRLGDVAVDDLGALMSSTEQVRFGSAKRDGLTTACRACPVLRLCRGGCPKDRIAVAPTGEAGQSYLCGDYLEFFTYATPYLEQMAALIRHGRPLGAIMTKLAQDEAADEARWRNAGRNDPCPCGSGRKFKRCCLGAHRFR
jgi:uncharacterized protein